MKPIRHLYRIGRSAGCAIAIGARTVAADDLNTRMLLQPIGEGLGGAIRQEVNRAMRVKINDNRAIGLAFTFGPVIDTDHARSWGRTSAGAPHEAQHSIRTDRHALTLGSSRGGFTAQVTP